MFDYWVEEWNEIRVALKWYSCVRVGDSVFARVAFVSLS